MLKEKTGIGPGLLFMVLYAALFSYGKILSPYLAAKYVGSNGYWGFVLAFLLAIVIVFILNALAQKFPQKSIIQFLPDVCGAVLGKFLGLIYLLFILFALSWTGSLVVQQSESYFLFRTPTSAIMLFFFAATAYIAHQGIEGISRLAAFIFPVTFVLIIMALGLSFQNFELDNIRPIFLIDGLKIPLGAVHMFYPFVTLITVLMIYPYLSEKHKVKKTMLGAVILASIVIFIAIVTCIGNYSAPGMLRYSWPAIEVTRKANLPFVFQTFGLFYTASYMTLSLVTSGFYYYVLAEGTAQLIGVLNYKWFTLILFLPIYFIMMFLFSGIIEVRNAFTYYRLIGFALTLGLPLFVWLISVIRKRGEK